MIGRRTWLLGLAFLAGCFDDPPAIDEGTGGDETGGPTVSVSGTVVSSWIPGLGAPVEGALVKLEGMPGVQSITDATGAFTLDGVPAGTPAYLSVAPSAADLGSVVGVDVEFIDVADVKIARFRKIDVDAQLDVLQTMDPSVEYDPSLGAILVVSQQANAEIGLQPTPAPGTFYALDVNGQPVLGATSSPYILPAVVFFDVAPAEAGVVQVSVDHPDVACSIALPSPPILGNHVSSVGAQCG